MTMPLRRRANINLRTLERSKLCCSSETLGLRIGSRFVVESLGLGSSSALNSLFDVGLAMDLISNRCSYPWRRSPRSSFPLHDGLPCRAVQYCLGRSRSSCSGSVQVDVVMQMYFLATCKVNGQIRSSSFNQELFSLNDVYF